MGRGPSAVRIPHLWQLAEFTWFRQRLGTKPQSSPGRAGAEMHPRQQDAKSVHRSAHDGMKKRKKKGRWEKDERIIEPLLRDLPGRQHPKVRNHRYTRQLPLSRTPMFSGVWHSARSNQLIRYLLGGKPVFTLVQHLSTHRGSVGPDFHFLGPLLRGSKLPYLTAPPLPQRWAAVFPGRERIP